MWRLIRRVIYLPSSQDTLEVWGVNRPIPGLRTAPAPPFTDVDDPLRSSCSLVLLLRNDYVTWDNMDQFLGVAEAAGYSVSGFKDPYSTIVLSKQRAST